MKPFGSFTKSLTNGLYEALVWVFHEIPYLGASQRPLLKVIVNPLLHESNFMEVASLCASQSSLPRSFAKPLTWLLYKAPFLGASQSPLLWCFMKPFGSFTKSLTNGLYEALAWVFHEIPYLGVSQRPLLKVIVNPLLHESNFMEVASLCASQSSLPRSFAKPLTWLLYKAPFLGASQSPLLWCFMKPFGSFTKSLTNGLYEALAWVFHEIPYLGASQRPLLKVIVNPLLHGSCFLGCFTKPLALVFAKPLTWVLHTTPCKGASWSLLPRGFHEAPCLELHDMPRSAQYSYVC